MAHPAGDVFVSRGHLGGAYDGETVLVRITSAGTDGRRREGRVIRVDETVPYVTTGVLHREKTGTYAACTGGVILRVPRNRLNGAVAGQAVMLELTRRADAGRAAEGRVTEILGVAGAPGVDILMIAHDYGLDARFPEEVERQVRGMDLRITEDTLAERRTLFDQRVFTIDGADAKDLDDAVSIEQLPNGNLLLGVHIADVSHYVREGTPLDREALTRGTSVYLVDRVIPMLPEALSNGVCSLNPAETRLTLSCFMEVDAQTRVVAHSIEQTAIRSCHRMTYEDVNAIFVGDTRLRTVYVDILPDLEQLHALTKRLRARRFAAGSIDLEIDEAKIELDDAGRPISVGVRARGDAEKLIEECMLLANNTVAERYAAAELPFVYRVHEPPDAERMRELAIFLSGFGVRLRYNETHSMDLQRALGACAGTEGEGVVNRVVLRSLKKARYATQNLGHFGLASRAYCHFTSPIRRYPDLQIHRIIKDELAGRLSLPRVETLERMLPGVAARSSARERLAIEAERAVDEIKKAEYIAQFMGDTFDGVVSGVTPSAIFVELPNTVEGVIPLSALRDDYYAYVRDQYCVIGARTRRRIALGDGIRVRVRAVDVTVPRVEFEPEEVHKKKQFENSGRRGILKAEGKRHANGRKGRRKK